VTVWGKAGQRLTQQQILERRGRRAFGRLVAERANDVAKLAWRRGELSPYAVTVALDLAGLFGPEADAKLGVEEPALDEWEAGTRYPEWSQVVALAAAAEMTPRALLRISPSTDRASSARFHDRGWQDTPAIERFTPAAIQATLSSSLEPEETR
jgi:hypothetical protein